MLIKHKRIEVITREMLEIYDIYVIYTYDVIYTNGHK